MRDPLFSTLEREWGIVAPPSVLGMQDPSWAYDFKGAMDAQPNLVTASSSGIPAFLSNYWDPEVVRILQAPMAAAEIAGEVKKGTWVTRTTTFTMIEGYGEVSSYGDWNNNGSTGINTNFPQRQSYYYQTITQWGERQLDEADLARINYANEMNMASVNILNRFQNRSYLLGIGNLQNYGYLNDPSLSASITPVPKAAGGFTWPGATPNEVFSDIQKLYSQLVAQSGGLITMDMQFTLVVSPTSNPFLLNINSFGITGAEMLKRSFPNLKVVVVPEYGVASGVVTSNTIQLICTSLDGVDSAYAAFNEKLRAHPIVIDLSAFKQKKSQGTWGAIIRRPFCIATMIGV